MAEATKGPLASERARAYWRWNVGLTVVLLVGWFLCSLGAGVLWAEPLNAYKLPGTSLPLGFWMAQQGSILSFLGLILVYAVVMNRLDQWFHAGQAADAKPAATSEGGAQ